MKPDDIRDMVISVVVVVYMFYGTYRIMNYEEKFTWRLKCIIIAYLLTFVGAFVNFKPIFGLETTLVILVPLYLILSIYYLYELYKKKCFCVIRSYFKTKR